VITPLFGNLTPLAAARRRSTYAEYVQGTINPALWLRFRETSGTTIANSGSGGTGLNGTASNVTVNQTGQLGAGEAADFNGTNSLITVPASASLGSATYSVAILCRLDNTGESAQGTFFRFGLNAANGDILRLEATGLSAYTYNGTAYQVTRATSNPALSTWVWVFAVRNGGGSGEWRLYRSVSGVLTEFAYGTQQNVTSGRPNHDSLPLHVGNRAVTLDHTLDGLLDEFIWTSGVLSTAQMQQIITLSGL
jgi:hypothetical protein